MRVKVRKRSGESPLQLLKRFLERYNKSGIVLEIKNKLYRTKKPNERAKKEARLYRLKLQHFIKQKMKEGWSFEKAYDLAKKYIQEIKYPGSD
jgi:DNA-binding transcriptional regulator YhcF (GntR family)